MRLLRYIKSGLAALFAMAMLLSCSSIMEDGGICPESDSVMMSFKMITSAPMTGTRADDFHKEVDSEYREFEDGINVNDFAFFIFVGEGDDAKLVVKNTNIASSTDPTTMITGSPGAYTVTVKMDRETLDTKLGHAIKREVMIKSTSVLWCLQTASHRILPEAIIMLSPEKHIRRLYSRLPNGDLR